MNSKVIGLTTLCLALALPLLAQGPRGSRERFGPPAGAHDGERTGSGERNPLGRLEEALALTPSQVASAEALFERHRPNWRHFRPGQVQPVMPKWRPWTVETQRPLEMQFWRHANFGPSDARSMRISWPSSGAC